MKSKEILNTNSFFLFLKGFLMGIAEIVPGVSGSTLALIFGIYKNFINLLYQISNFVKEVFLFCCFKSSIKNILKVSRKIDLKFGGILFLGMLCAIALFSNIVSFLIYGYREYVMAFFFGLVLASIAIPWGEIKKKTIKEFTIAVLTSIIFFFILSITPTVLDEAPGYLYFFVGGALGICAMVLPGVSGSFIFLMIGLYEHIVKFVSNFTKFDTSWNEVLSLISLALGIVFGFSIFVRFLKSALKTHSEIIYAFLTGLMVASLRVLWPFEHYYDYIYILLTMLLGFLLVTFLKKFKL